MSDYYEFVRANAEKRWDGEQRRFNEAIARYTADVAKLDDSPFSLLYSAVLAWGPIRIAEVAPRVVPLVKQAIAVRSGEENKSIAELGVANLANLFACCGYPDETTPTSDWLSEIRTYPHDEDTSFHWNKAFAALAVDQQKLYLALAGYDPTEPLTMTPSARFGGNLQGLLRHFAGAVEHGADFAAVEPAWRDFVANLNRHEDTRQIDRATPFWIARVVHHRIGGAPLGSVAQWLHEQIRDA
jgi:hypothetical protein